MKFQVRDPHTEKLTRQMDVLIAEVRNLNATLEKSIKQDTQQGAQIMADLSALEAEVSENTEVVSSAVTLIQGLSQALKDAIAANDPAAIQALADQLDANTQSLAAAVDNVPHPEQR